MTPHKILLISLVIVQFNINSAFSQESLKVHRDKSLSTLRGFLTTLNKSSPGPQRDSLNISITNLIASTKSDTSYKNLTFLVAYFNQANESLSTSNGDSAINVQKFINMDLDLKQSIKSDTSKHFSSYNKIFEGRDVKVNVSINGNKPNGGTFTVYWFNFEGAKREPMIKRDIFTQCSKQYRNPCDLQVVLPGYITFWMKDKVTGQYYESDQDYYKLTKSDNKIDINFIAIH